MDEYQMSLRDKDKLRTSRLYLLKNIAPSGDLLDYLWSTKILTDEMKEEIEVEKTTRATVARLLDTLPRRGPTAYQELVYGLMESGQEHAAVFLSEEHAQAWRKDNATSPAPPPSHRHHGPPGRQTSSRARPVMPRQPSSPPRPVTNQENESSLLMLDVQPVDLEDSSILKLLGNSKDVYPMKRKPRGRALIINNSYFVNSPAREGAAFDSLNLCEHFKQLDFETVLYDEVTAEDMRSIFSAESHHEDHWNADCFIAFVMSHGSQGYIYGIDGQKLSIEADIVTQFDGDHCKSLVNKPKMFFFQACQGDSATEGTTPRTGDSEVDAAPFPSNPETEKLQQAFVDLRIQDTAQSLPMLSRTHEKSDIVLAYSTVPGYRSWRRTDLGSWFVRAIVEVFSAEAHKEDLLSLLVKVRKRVSEHHTNHEDRSFIQLTRTDETTKKKIFFFPGYHEAKRGDRV